MDYLHKQNSITNINNKIMTANKILFKTFTITILLIALVNFLYSCKKTETITLKTNAIIKPNGIGLISDNNDTITIVLEPITEITAHSGRASGNVTLIGDSNGFGNLGYGIYWDTIKNPSINPNNCVLKNFSEDFSFLMYNLQPSTRYYVGLFLTQTDNNGTVSSHTTVTYHREFTTLDE